MASTQATQRLADGGRVMREVIDDGDALGDPAQLLSALDAGEQAHAADKLG